MKHTHLILALILYFLSTGNLRSQCSDIYIYRFLNITQCDVPVLILHDGETIAELRSGDRVKAQICVDGKYEFVAKTNADGLLNNKTTINVNGVANHYLKVGCAVGVVSIKKMDGKKGASDIKRGAKFSSAFEHVRIQSTPASNQGGILANNSARSSNNNGDFQRSQTAGVFKFDIVDVIRAGDDIEFKYKITNLAGIDKLLRLNGRSMMFYDNLGNFYSATSFCIMESCKTARALTQPTPSVMNGKYYSAGGSVGALIPRGIPVNASIKFSSVDIRADRFLRGELILMSSDKDGNNRTDVNLNYQNIIFPSDIDVSNPNKRNVGDQSIELIEVNRRVTDLFFKFRIKNNSLSTYNAIVKSGQFWDNTGNQHIIQEASFDNKYELTNIEAPYRFLERDLLANQNVDFYLKSNGVSSGATAVSRISVMLKDFELTWENVPITSETNETVQSTPASIGSITFNSEGKKEKYISYDDFEYKLTRQESVIGKKIILENIYFQTASDDILPASYGQLDKLATSLSLNQNLNLEVSGHTDNIGDGIANMLLSQKRADAIKYYLIRKAINPSRISSVGKGDETPVASNQSVAGREKNRRVEITILD